jgi:sugar phosphate isomerase/epimerase
MDVTGYGVCTWVFGDLPLADVCGRVVGVGYDGVELLGEIDKLARSEVRRALTGHGLKVYSLTPANVDLAHPDAAIRSQAVGYYLSLLDFAAQVGSPLISCHGAVGRIRAVAGWQEEWDLLVAGVGTVARRAQELGIRVGLELLNRYESHLLNTVDQGLRLLDEVGLPNVGLHLDAYHMNIEEPDPAGAIRQAGRRLVLFHAADSNRQGIGRGHTDFAGLFGALGHIDYVGPIVMECPAPGPDPFRAIKDEESVPWVEAYLRESLPRLRALVGSSGASGSDG